MNTVKKFFELLFYTFFPKICFCCNKPMDYFSKYPICKSCVKQIKFIDGLVCDKCGLPLDSGGKFCYNCKKQERKFYFDFVRGVVEYKEPIKTLIHEFKYNQKTFLVSFLGEILINGYEKKFNNTKIDILCCVPMHRIKKFIRGYNQAELLAEMLSKKFNLNFVSDLLIRRKYTVSQFKLSQQKRIENVKDVFEINQKFKDQVKGKNILIIDDVCTTAETINQCAKVLKKYSAKNVFGFVLARDV
jgi:competence protein ComFC